jgi:hypothetical protein
MNLQEYKKRYDEGSMKMNPELENIIKTKNNEVFSNPAFPKIDKDGNATNYIELLSYKRFLDCLDKFVYYTNIQNLNNQNAFGILQQKLGEAVFKVIEIESSHKPYLKDLGINLIIEELGLPSDAFVFENELVGLKNVQSEKTELEGKEPTQQQIENEFSETAEEEFMTANEMYELEKQKRRLINMFIQGASKKGHYMFQLVRDDLNRINPELVNLYGIIMSINDLTYWIIPEFLMKVMASSNVTKAGLESIEEDEGKTKIKTQSINFPVSLHEMIKGVYEVFGTHGLPDNPLAQEMVIESTDTLMNEIWDIRFGVSVWEKFLQSFPMEVFESDKKYLQHYLFMRLCSLDAHQLFKISRYIISDDPRGVKFIENMVRDINIDVNKREVQNIFGHDDEDYEYEMGGYLKSKLEVELGSINDPNLIGDKKYIKPLKVRISTLEEASEVALNFIKKHNLKSTNYVYGNIYRDGKKIGRVTYTGDIKKISTERELYFKGGEANEKEEDINYNKRRIKNLKELIPLVDETKKIELLKQIESIEKEILDIENPNPNTEVKKRKPFLFFEKGGKAEDEYDVYDNKRMLENQANEVEHHSEELNEQVKLTKKVPAWVIAKMERATTDLSDITHYLDGENKMEFGGKVGKKYNIGDVEYEVVPFPRTDKFAILTYTYDNIFGQDEWLKNIIRDFKGNPMQFNDIKSAQNYIDDIVIKYPLGGIKKANYGAILFASQLAQKQQQPQQVVYYIPQQAESIVDTEIVQNMPEYNDGGQLNNKDLNDMCITEIIELANELQEVKYYKTSRHKNDIYSEKYDGKLIIVFKEPVQVKTIESINDFIEQADGCEEIFEQSVNVSGEQEKSMYIYLKTPVFSDLEYKNGGKVYEYPPKKINIDKTTKITTNLGDYNLGLVTKEFIYFVNPIESDENAQTIMYNKKGDLVSDNIFATNDLFEVLETENDFEFIHPDMQEYRKSILDKE